VSQWDDQSGQNNHFVQENADKQPQVTGSVINGYPVVSFGGDDDVLESALTLDATTYPAITVYTVEIIRGLGGGLIAVWSTDGDVGGYLRARVFGTSGELYLLTGSGLYQPTNSAAIDSARMIGDVYSTTDIKTYIDGLGFSRGSPSTATSAYPLRLGDGYQYNQSAHLDIAEMLVYNHELSTEERGQLEVYL